jgi:RNA polymerase sigma-70 factor (ECF subfamily)
MQTMSEAANLSSESGLPPWFAVELARVQIPLLAFIRGLTACSADAWDVLQDVNQVICQKGGSIKSGPELLPWGYTIARHKVLHYRRRAARERLVFSEEMLDRVADRVSALGADYSDRVAALEGCLKKLPERQQQYFRLRYSDNLGVREISQRVGRAENAISVALHRARTALAGCVEVVLAGGSR